MANLFDKLTGKSNNTVGNVDKFSNSVSELSNTLMDFNKDFKSTTTSFSNDLRSILGKASQESSDDTEERSQDNDAFLRRLDSSTGKTINKAQVISSAAIKSFEIVANYSIKKFTDASSRIISDYNQNLTAITVRQQWTNEQYTKELREATAWIKNNGLAAQFSQIDWTSALSDALSMGLRDEVAVRVAEQNLITNKLLPQLNTNSRTYTRASKLLGDDLSKNVVAIGKYTEQVYGAEGLEDGQINNVMETIANEIIAGGAQKGLSETEVSAQIGNVLGTYQQYSAQYGAGYAENVLGTLKGIMTGDTNDVMAMAAARDSGISIGDASSLTPEAISRYFDLYTQQTETYAPNGAGIMSNLAGFGNYDNYLAVQAGNAYGDKYQDWMSQVSGTVDANSYYNSQVNDLTKGAYQSITDQQNKWNENMVANASSWLAEKIPDTEGVLNNISNIVTTWFGTWVALNAAGKLFGKGGEGSSTLGSKLGTKVFGKGGAKAAFSQGGKFALTTADGAGGTMLTGLGTGLSVASILGGLVWGGVDAGKAVSRAKESGLDTRSAGVQGFFTGSSTAGMDWQSKKAYYDQNGYFSIKDMSSNAGKGALIGLGAGSLAGHPIIGAAAGAIVGGVMNFIDQKAEAHDFKKFADALTDATNATQALTQANQEYKDKMASTQDALTAIDALQNSNMQATASNTAALQTLKTLYPKYTKNISDVSDLDEEYLETLKTKIEREEYLNELNAYNSDWKDNTLDKDLVGQAGITTYNEGMQAFADYASKNPGILGDNWSFMSGGSKYGSFVQEHYADYGYDSADAYGKALEDAGLIESHWSEFSTDDAITKDYTANLDKYSRETQQASDAYKTYLEQLSEVYTNFENSYATYQDEQKSTKTRNQAKSNIIDNISKLTESMNNMKAFVDELGGEYPTTYHEDVTLMFPDLEDIYSLAKQDIPNFRIGTDFITNGGPIMSHLGEAILTPDTTKKLSHLANGAGGITGFVNTLFSLSKSDVPTSSAVANDTELSMDPVVDAIKEQTAELQDSLAKIIVLISSLVPETSFAQVDQLLATYQGASA